MVRLALLGAVVAAMFALVFGLFGAVWTKPLLQALRLHGMMFSEALIRFSVPAFVIANALLGWRDFRGRQGERIDWAMLDREVAPLSESAWLTFEVMRAVLRRVRASAAPQSSMQ